jgi:hypothetical protein
VHSKRLLQPVCLGLHCHQLWEAGVLCPPDRVELSASMPLLYLQADGNTQTVVAAVDGASAAAPAATAGDSTQAAAAAEHGSSDKVAVDCAAADSDAATEPEQLPLLRITSDGTCISLHADFLHEEGALQQDDRCVAYDQLVSPWCEPQ